MGASGNTSRLSDNKYQYEDQLASGAFGRPMLYKGIPMDAAIIAKYPHVAIKLMSTHDPSSPYYTDETTFQKEAETLLMLNNPGHPGIIGFVECYIHQPSGRLAIVTEFCCDGNLLSYLKKYRPDITKRYNWYKQLASAVQYLHGKQVIHCNIKPRNIVINCGILKLCDVGLANSYHKTSTFYRAPEIWEKETPTIKCDIYSLGLVFLTIAESPNPIILEAKHPTIERYHHLGELLYIMGDCGWPCDYYPSIKYATEMEKFLFNKMLNHRSEYRFNIDQVLTVVNNLKVSQEEKQNQLDACIQNLSTQALTNIRGFLHYLNQSIEDIEGPEADAVRDKVKKTMDDCKWGQPNSVLVQFAKDYLDLLTCCDTAIENYEATSKRLKNDARQKNNGLGLMLGIAGLVALPFAIPISVAAAVVAGGAMVGGAVLYIRSGSQEPAQRYKIAAEKLSKGWNPDVTKTCHLINHYASDLYM